MGLNIFKGERKMLAFLLFVRNLSENLGKSIVFVALLC